jgi:hypothetical protein
MFAKKSQPVEDRKVGHYKAAEKRRHAVAQLTGIAGIEMRLCGSRLAGDGVRSDTDAITSASHSIATVRRSDKPAPTGIA